jgi:hypothetical protein
MTYATDLAQKVMLEGRVKAASDKMKAFPSGAMGLTPDNVKFSPEFRRAKREFDTAFAALRRFNGAFLARYRKEVLADRRARSAMRELGL